MLSINKDITIFLINQAKQQDRRMGLSPVHGPNNWKGKGRVLPTFSSKVQESHHMGHEGRWIGQGVVSILLRLSHNGVQRCLKSKGPGQGGAQKNEGKADRGQIQP
jgi:hypothetical protein